MKSLCLEFDLLTMIKQINAKNHPSYNKHEKVFYFEDKDTKLRGYIAWHNTKLGPATGGTRLYPYKTDIDALTDVLNLSQAMSYKGALSGVPFGGGKAVIIGNPTMKSEKFLEAYANVISSLNGKYTTGTDVGITDKDTNFMSKKTPYILKGNSDRKTTSGMAARGVYYGILAAITKIIPNKNLRNITIGIKGIGKLGGELARLCLKAGMQVWVADIDTQKIREFKRKYPKIHTASYKTIHAKKFDVYAPCALGKEFTVKNIKDVRSTIIAGGANNQFADTSLVSKLHTKGIWYIPDYVLNAGGLIHIVDELDKAGYNKSRVQKRIQTIGTTIASLIKQAKQMNKTPLELADERAHTKLHGKQTKKKK